MDVLFRSSDTSVSQFLRHYRQLLTSPNGGILLSEFDNNYKSLSPLIHSLIKSPDPDIDLLNFVQNRLPDCLSEIKKIVISSNSKVEASLFDIGKSVKVNSPSRRRLIYFDQDSTLFIPLSSLSDLDDLFTCLCAYRIESIKTKSKLKVFNPLIISLGLNEQDFINQTNNWWQENINRSLYLNLNKEPVYFLSSDHHSLVNIIGGFFSKKQTYIFDFVAKNYPEIYQKWFELKSKLDIYHTNDFLYYLAGKFLSKNQDFIAEKQKFESDLGIINLPINNSLPINLQIIPLKILGQSPYFDSNLRINKDLFTSKSGVIINIQYPLGMAAKDVLNSFFKYFSNPKGVYVIGKAAILNGSVGDIQIPEIVLDEFTNNIYKFSNIFNSFFPFQNNISQIFQNQKSVCVYSTLLETEAQINNYKKINSNIIEMESGHYLASIVEKYISKKDIDHSFYYNIDNLPIDLGIINYASDNPLTQNLTKESINFSGIETTYLPCLSVIQRIIDLESL